MSRINPLSTSQAQALTAKVNGHGAHASPASPAASNRAGQDSVDVSPAARLLSRLQELPEVRQDVVDRVRAQIADGQYETDEKINEALRNLIDEGDLL